MATIEVLRTVLTAEDDGFSAAMRTAELSTKQFNEVLKRGEATYQATRTEIEKYETKIGDLQQQLAAGAIDQETFNRAVKQAEQALPEYRAKLDAAADAERRFLEAAARGKSVMESVRTPLERYNVRLAELKRLLDQGHISHLAFNRAVRQAQTSLNAATKPASSFLSNLSGISPVSLTAVGGIMAVAGAARHMAEGLAAATERLDALDDAATKLGVSAEGLQGFGKAAQLVGVETQKLEQSIGKMNANIGKQLAEGGESAFSDQLKKMKIDIMELNDPEQALFKFADAISELNTPAEQAAAAVAVFGRSGIDLLPLLKEGAEGIREQIKEFKELGLIIDGMDVKKVGDMADKMASLGQVSEGVFENMKVRIAPLQDAMTTGLRQLTKEVGGAKAVADAAIDGLVQGLSGGLLPGLPKLRSGGGSPKAPDKSAFINAAAIEAAEKAAEKEEQKLESAAKKAEEQRLKAFERAFETELRNIQRLGVERHRAFEKEWREREAMEKKLADDTERLLEGAMNPLEKAEKKFDETLAEADRLFRLGRIGVDELTKVQNAAVNHLAADMASAEKIGMPKLKDAGDISPAALERGSTAAFSAIAKASNAGFGKDREKVEKDQLAEQKQQTKLQREMVAAAKAKPQVARF